MTMKHAVILIAGTLLLAGCASTSTSSDLAVVRLTEGGSQIQILNSEAVAQTCANLGEVKAYPPYILPDDARNTLRNKAAELGADAIYVTNYLIAPATANAYQCRMEKKPHVSRRGNR